MTSNPEQHILDSWHSNAAAWTNAIDQQSIESRRLITNKAIVDAIAEQKPSNVLDIRETTSEKKSSLKNRNRYWVRVIQCTFFRRSRFVDRIFGQ